ncbi:pyridoxal phosphate-dependent aminotransferase [Belliella kenyensis]|uniref:Pyridoxal phosphate-dependent aminotransferase n=1 Tax=Belliella kenyensis TaxID=1472724 RepID=A0ABV8EQU0_9BACT|nr:histidinol-phosphate transaminase [Belliella kenyensis]MCH7403358.1 histidinol-phosphate aminotransferase family protein [Belliella kenyensis]MDN3601570.1 histidinol-phosphate transaminase [Belliella kenyensis]
MKKSINRRSWIKKSFLGIGAIASMPKLVSAMDVNAAFPKSSFYEITPREDFNAPRMLARLSANENPYGPSPAVVEAIKEAVVTGNRYAHRDASDLIEMIAKKEGVSPKHIMLGPGSSDLLEKMAFVSFPSGGNIVSADPAYMSIISTARALGASWKPVKLKSDYSHDLMAMKSAIDNDTKLVYVCNPNNPTGSITASDKLRTFCSDVSTKVPVFVDEAYLEFLDDSQSHSMVDLVTKGDDVIVARTFSKIHGMAGLRIGYIVAQPERISAITDKVRSTMGLCSTSLKGAIASMSDAQFTAECKKLNTECRNYVVDKITSLGYDVIPSSTSFVLFPIAMDGMDFMKAMNESGVSIRVFSIDEKPYCRVSMGTMEEMEYFVETFEKVTA